MLNQDQLFQKEKAGRWGGGGEDKENPGGELLFNIIPPEGLKSLVYDKVPTSIVVAHGSLVLLTESVMKDFSLSR